MNEFTSDVLLIDFVMILLRLADTVVLTHPSPGLSQTPFANAPMDRQEILEKPISKEDNLRMLLDLNGGVCEVVTGVTVGVSIYRSMFPVQDSRTGCSIPRPGSARVQI